MTYFKKAKQIFPLSLVKEMNVSLLFVLDLDTKEGTKLFLSGNSDYSVYLDGDLIHYGPARAAIHEYRVDVLPLSVSSKKRRLVVILPWYNCLSYTRVSEPPFFIAEVRDNEDKVLFVSKDFSCYRFSARLQKVVRFSYQREFSEYYVGDERLFDSLKETERTIPLEKLECQETSEGSFLERKVPYVDFSIRLPFMAVEHGSFYIDGEKSPYRDRYMTSDYLRIFPLGSYERNPSDFISVLSYKRNDKTGDKIGKGEFITYEHPVSKTGFFNFKFKVEKKATIHFVFDEIDTRKEDEDTIGVLFYRNTTHNIISYELKEGEYSLFAAEPYTAKFVRAIVEDGEAEIEGITMIPFENPLVSRFIFEHEDKDLVTIIEAAKNSFAQNAVDILMDCPSRERAGWLCDTYFSGRSENLITGKNLVERNFLENYAHYVNQGDQPKGMIPMCYPSDFADRGFIPNWPMFYVLEIAEYLKRHNDERLLKEAKKQLFDFYAWCERFKNEKGLLEDLEGVVFIEWSHANDLESTRGINFPTNMLYSAFLNDLGSLYKKEELRKEGESLEKTVREMAYNGSFFVDNALRNDKDIVLTDRISETTQYYAFYFGIANKEDYPSLFDSLKEELGPSRDITKVLPNVFPSNMFIGDYMRLLVLLQNGEYLRVYEECKQYFLEMAKKTGTIWEFDSTYASLTHCFASYAVNILLEVLTGITRIDEKDKRVTLSSYAPLDVGNFSISIPTNDETIKVSSHNGEISYVLPNGYSLLR